MADGLMVLSTAAASSDLAGTTSGGVGDAEECMMSSTVPRFRKWLGVGHGPRQDMVYKREVDVFLSQVLKRSGTLGQTAMSLGWQRAVGAIEADMSTLVDVPAEALAGWQSSCGGSAAHPPSNSIPLSKFP